ncbi:unnamed protein product [Lactuca virosa]|uniref:Uncharacterized protein n=1 Tax=Lactuca virosa TaxID=75947 RepID=A0AAU9M7B8_9ASTR|nr:unnamed protein product [Lactuca virosa]
MASKEDGQTSKAKSLHKASQSHATGPSTETNSSSPKIDMVASNYAALLNTQEQPKEVGVIVEYLQKFPLAYALISTSPTPQSLITEVFQSTVISTRASLGLSDISHQPQTFVTPSSAQLLTMFKEMGYKFEDKTEPCLSRIRKSCLPTSWHFLSSVLTGCLFGSVSGRSREDFLNFLPDSKNKFLIHHPRWWSIIINDAIHNSNLAPGWIPEGPQPHFLCMKPYRIRTTSESDSSHPLILPDDILTKLDENSASLCSYQKYIQGIILPPKNKRKHSDHASKKLAKKKKISKSNQPPPIPSLVISNDNLGADLDEPTSPPKSGTSSKPHSFLDSLFQAPSDYDEPSSPAPVSATCFQSVLEIPSNRVSLDYDSLEDDDQNGEKQIEPEDLPKSSPVEDNQDEDTSMQTVDIPTSEGLVVDDEPHDMSIVLYSNAPTRTFSIDLDDYSPPTPKESQEKDDTPKETDEANTTEPEPERIRLTAQMLLVDEVKYIKTQSSSSPLCALQLKVASTDSKLELILAKLYGSNDRPPEPEAEILNKIRSSQSPVIHHIPDSPNEFEKRRPEKTE